MVRSSDVLFRSLRRFIKTRLVWLVASVLLGVSVFVSQYWATGGFFFLSRFSDLAWLKSASVVMGELPPDHSLSPSLFAYAIAFMKGFVKDSFVALEVASFLFHLTLVVAVCLIAISLLRSWSVGILTGVLLAVHPSMVAVLQMSAYSVIAALAWLVLAVYISIANPSGGAFLSFTLALLSVLAAVSDPHVGLILVVASVLGAVIGIKRGFSRKVLAAPLASIPGGLVGALFLLFYGSDLTLPKIVLEPAILALTLLAALFGGLLLYERRNLQSLKRLACWLVASLATPLLLNVPLLTVVSVYALPPLLIFASALLSNVDRGIVRVVEAAASEPRAESGEAEKLVELDAAKIVSVVLLALLVLSGLVGSHGVYTQVNASYRRESEWYGDVELREALAWISVNTPKHVVVAAEHPLGDWVEAVAGRVSLSNKAVDFRGDIEGFLRSYAADSMLGANYEVRNAFLRLRDWGPVAPQRVPFFAVSDGERFTDFLYVDESQVKVTYVIGDSLFTPDFYNYSVRYSGWVDRSSTVAVLRHVFEVEGVLINKTIRLSKGAAEASVEYLVEAKPGASLRGFSLKAWVPWDRRLGYTRVLGSRVELSLDVGDFLIIFEGDVRSVDFGPDRAWSQQRAEAQFTPLNGRIYAKMTVKASTSVAPIVWSGDEVVAYATKELMAEYHVAYAVVPTMVKKQSMDRFGLDFPTFLSMFENTKLTVYKVIISS